MSLDVLMMSWSAPISTHSVRRNRHAAANDFPYEASFALMRGHGSVAVGNSVKQVVYRAIYAEVNARLQADAMRLGKVTLLNDDEATNAATASDAHLDRPGELWKRKGTDH